MSNLGPTIEAVCCCSYLGGALYADWWWNIWLHHQICRITSWRQKYLDAHLQNCHNFAVLWRESTSSEKYSKKTLPILRCCNCSVWPSNLEEKGKLWHLMEIAFCVAFLDKGLKFVWTKQFGRRLSSLWDTTEVVHLGSPSSSIVSRNQNELLQSTILNYQRNLQ